MVKRMEYSEQPSLTSSQIDDLRLAASKMNLVDRRSFQAEMTLKYCDGKARLAETYFGWGRDSVELALAEKRTGLLCIGALNLNKTQRFRVLLPIRD
jgi:hypothetical protein